MKKNTAALIYLLSIVCLIPGLVLPVMTIKATVDKNKILDLTAHSIFPADESNPFIEKMVSAILQQLNVEGTVEAFEKTRSILGTMSELIAHGHIVVGVMIGLFAVIIPLLKIAMTLVAHFFASPQTKNKLLKKSSLISKWSMSDVFVMAIMVAFMAVNANDVSFGAVQVSASLGAGFYCFVAYCLLAIAAGQLIAQSEEPESIKESP